MHKIYITYDVLLKRHLRNYGINDILYGLNPKSLKPFWVYERTNELEIVLNSWFNKKMLTQLFLCAF